MKHGYKNAHNKQNCTDQKGEAHPESQPTMMSSLHDYVMNDNDDIGTGPAAASIMGAHAPTGKKETQENTSAYG